MHLNFSWKQMSIQLLQGIKDRPVKLSHPSLAYKTSRFTGVIYRHMSDSEVAASMKTQHSWENIHKSCVLRPSF